MKKKVGITLLFALVCSCLFAFAGCGGHEHSWDEGKITTPATCSAAGVKTYTCSCGETKTEPVAADPDAHVWNEGEITTPATCTEKGVKTFTCTLNPKHTRTEDVETDETAHPFPEEWQHDENKHWHLSTCGHAVKGEEAEHEWEVVRVLTEATCVRTGSQEVRCSVCGETKTEDTGTDPDNHPYASAWTGSEEGHYHAARCGHDVHSTPEEHTFDNGRVTKAADCGVAGETTYTCTVCKWTKTEPLPAAKEHTFDEEHWEYDVNGHWNLPTCAEGSNVDHSGVKGNYGAHTSPTGTCTVCGYTPVALSFEIANGNATVTGFAEGVDASAITALYIPDFYQDKPVTAIKAGTSSAPTFGQAATIESVSFPASLASIGNYAFADGTKIGVLDWRGTLEEYLGLKTGSSNSHPFSLGAEANIFGTDPFRSKLYIGGNLLTEADIPASAAAIPDYAFYRCADITKVTFTGNSALEKIGVRAFGYLDKITEIVVPDSVKKIGKGAFAICGSLQKMVLPFIGASSTESKDAETALFGYIFNLCEWGSAKVPDLSKVPLEGFYHTKQFFGSYAAQTRQFYTPVSLTSLTFTGGKLFMGALAGLKELTELKFSTDDLTAIPARCFEECEKVTSLDIGQNVLTIGDNAFYKMSALTSIDLGTKLTAIGRGAFNGCGLTEIRFPATLRTVGKNIGSTLSGNVFGKCAALKKVYAASIADWCKIEFSGTTRDNNPLNNGAALYADGNEVVDFVIPQEITKLSQCAFAGCTSIKSVKIGAQVTEIGIYCFDKMTDFTITFEDPANWEAAQASNSSKGDEVPASFLTGTVSGADYLAKYNLKYLRKKA